MELMVWKSTKKVELNNNLNVKNMELEHLGIYEVTVINGGTKSDYGFGHAVGDHIRHGVQTFGDIVDWFFGLVHG